jgi:hypothetical protein
MSQYDEGDGVSGKARRRVIAALWRGEVTQPEATAASQIGGIYSFLLPNTAIFESESK